MKLSHPGSQQTSAPNHFETPTRIFFELARLRERLEVAPLFRKVAPITPSEITIVPEGETRLIETWINGKLETTKPAKGGDYILTGVVGEKFVSSPKSFNAIHLWSEEQQAYLPQHRIRAIYLPVGGIVRASWGEDMVMEPGAIAAFRLNDNRFYGNQASSFELSYVRALEDESILCALTLPLIEQHRLAENAGARQHIADIEERMAHAARNHGRSACPQ